MSCQECGYQYYSILDMLNHLNQCHGEEEIDESNKCQFCGVRFNKNQILRKITHICPNINNYNTDYLSQEKTTEPLKIIREEEMIEELQIKKTNKPKLILKSKK